MSADYQCLICWSYNMCMDVLNKTITAISICIFILNLWHMCDAITWNFYVFWWPFLMAFFNDSAISEVIRDLSDSWYRRWSSVLYITGEAKVCVPCWASWWRDSSRKEYGGHHHGLSQWLCQVGNINLSVGLSVKNCQKFRAHIH